MASETATKNVGKRGWSALTLHLACGLLMLAILLSDLSIPLGVAMGVLYISAVLLSLWSPHPRFTVLVALISSVFIVAALLYKPEVPEMWKAVFNRGISLFAVWVAAVLGLQRKKTEQKREMALREREMALEDVRILRGLLPICASCKKIRNDQGYWVQIEGYIRDHSEVEFSHGICQECAAKIYPEFCERGKNPSQVDT